MNDAKIMVWDLATRAFHWLLALSFLGAYLSAEADRFQTLHVIFGYTVAALLLFRIAWGIVGTRHARFSAFALSPRAALDYVRSLFSGPPQHFVGHNPLGSWSAVALLVLLALVVVTGMADYLGVAGEISGELHEGAASAALVLVLLHIAGVITSSVLHGENLVRSMLSGYKRGDAKDAVTGARTIPALAVVAAVAAFWSGALVAPGMRDNPGLLAALTQPDAGDEGDDRQGRHGRREERHRD
jgi:cytochrome b